MHLASTILHLHICNTYTFLLSSSIDRMIEFFFFDWVYPKKKKERASP